MLTVQRCLLFEFADEGAAMNIEHYSSFNISAGLYVSPMRLKSSIWVAAYLRRCQTEGVFGAVRRRGAVEAGGVFVKVATLGGNVMLYVPAPQAVYGSSRPIPPLFLPLAIKGLPGHS